MTQPIDAAKARKFVENVFCAGYHHDPDKMIQESEWLPFVAELLTLACPTVPGDVREAAERLTANSWDTYAGEPGNRNWMDIADAILRDGRLVAKAILSGRGAGDDGEPKSKGVFTGGFPEDKCRTALSGLVDAIRRTAIPCPQFPDDIDEKMDAARDALAFQMPPKCSACGWPISDNVCTRSGCCNSD